MKVETLVAGQADERVNHYFGLAARIAFAVTSIGCVVLAGWFVFEALALGDVRGLRNAALVAMPPVAGMAVFTALQLRWHAWVWAVPKRADRA